MIKKKTIAGICVVLMLLSIGGSQAMIDLTGTQTGAGGGGFSGKYTDLDFAGTTGFSDLVDNISDGGFTYSNWFNQTLNTSDNPTFAGLTLDGNVDMNHNDINNVFEIECENDISVGNDIQLNDKLEHKDDTDTYLDFNINQITLVAGGVNVLDMLSTLATFGVNVTMNENLTVDNNITSSGRFIGNGSGLTIDWDKIYDIPAGFADGVDDVGSGSGNPFNQSLNTTDVVNFTGLNIAKNSYPIVTVIGVGEDEGGKILLGDSTQNNYLTLSGENGEGIGVWTTGEELILGAMSVGRGISFYANGTDVGHWMSNGYLGVGETNTDNIENRLRVVGNVNVTGYYMGNGSLLTDINWSNLTNMPAGFADGIDNESTSVYWADNVTLNQSGYVFAINTSIFGENLTWDGKYLNATDAVLSEAEVDAYVANNGYLTSYNETDPWFNSSIAHTLQSTWLDDWNTSFIWGDHSGLYSLLGHVHDFNYSGYNQDLNTTSDVTFNTVTGNGSGLSINWSNLYSVPAGFADNIDNTTAYNQDLNSTDSPTFNDITLTNYPNLDKDSTDDITAEVDPWFNSSVAYTILQAWINNWNTSFGWGDHAGLYSLLGHIHPFNYSGYNQNLNTTSAVTFDTVDTGQGANELYDMNQNVLTSSNVEFENVTVDNTLDMSNGGVTWNMYVNATGVLVWEIE